MDQVDMEKSYDNITGDWNGSGETAKFVNRIFQVGKKTVEWLLDYKNLNINQVGDGGLLHYAAMAGDLEMMKFLIGRGANCSLADKDGQVPLSWAMIQKDCLPAVKLLVESGADVNYSGTRTNLLEEARRRGRHDAAEYLREKGAQTSFSGTVDLPGGVKLQMVKIPAGKFDRLDKTITISKDFYSGKYEVTQQQCRR